MGITVWVDGWQLQCCGEPFRLGSQVAWTLRAAAPRWLGKVLGADAPAVDAWKEHHGGVPEDTAPTRGTITRIVAVHYRSAPVPGKGPAAALPIPRRGVLK
jgi:hypothetical protein